MKSEMITTTDEMIECAPDRLLGVEQYIGKPYADVSAQLDEYDWDGWYPVVSNGIYIGIVPSTCSDEFVWDESLDVMVPADEEITLPKIYYILTDMEGYGSEYPVCVDRAEAERLVRAWDKEDFNEIWREASEEEIAKYGRYDTDEE